MHLHPVNSAQLPPVAAAGAGAQQQLSVQTQQQQSPARLGTAWVLHTVRRATCLTGTKAGVLV
jgi:hypothetical protein